MKANRSTLVIHLDGHRFRMLAARSSLWDAMIPDLEEIPFRLGGVESGDSENSNLLFKKIESFTLKNSLKKPTVILSVSRNLLIWKYIAIPPVPPEELDNLIHFEIEKHLPVKREDIYLQYLPVEKTDDKWTVLLMGTRKDFLHGLEEAFKMLGFEKWILIPDLWGLVYFLKKQGHHLGNGYDAVVHAISDTVEIAVFKDEAPCFYRQYKLPSPSEEEADVPLALRASRQIDDVARAIHHGLVEAVQELSIPEKIGIGYLFSAEKTVDLVARGLEATPVERWQRAIAPPMNQKPGKWEWDHFFPAVGLGMGEKWALSSTANLLPRGSTPKREPVSYKLTTILSIVLIAVMLFLVGSMQYRRKDELHRLETAIANIENRVEAVKTVNERLKTESLKIENLESVFSERIRIIDVLDELTSIVPPTAYLNQITVKQRLLQMSGFADSASELIAKLEASPMFKNVSFAAPITSQGQQKERFTIKLTLEKELP